MPNFATSTTMVVLAGATVSFVLFVGWTGLLFHRVLRLPREDREHGLAVLKQFTSLVRAGFMQRPPAPRRVRRQQAAAGEGPAEDRTPKSL
jgi:hypothetical protein